MVALIGIEEHWTFEPIDKALRAMSMDEQGVDLQVLSLAPPGWRE